MIVNALSNESTSQAELTMAGERLVMRGDRSLFFPGQRTLFVADTHFGKAGVFRRRGMNVPSGTTDADLVRLEAALTETGAARLVVLGDFVHAPPTRATPWLARFADWRARHAGIEIIVTRGNHDRVRELPLDCDIDWRPGARMIGPFVCQHEPGADARGPVLAGHIHPVARLGSGTERIRLPVFWRHADGLMLPAFSSFAGGGRVSPDARDRMFVVADGEVIEAAMG